jgi:hypothetical protein
VIASGPTYPKGDVTFPLTPKVILATHGSLGREYASPCESGLGARGVKGAREQWLELYLGMLRIRGFEEKRHD